MEHTEDLKKIKEMVGNFLSEIAEEKRASGSNIAVIKEAVSAYQKISELCDDEDGAYGARRRDSRGRYMDGGVRSGMGGPVYGWVPAPYYGADNASLAATLEQIASNGRGTEAMNTALRNAARYLLNS